MVQQVSLSSGEYEKDTDEFIKAGFSKLPSTLIKPPRVKEAKVQMECNVIEIKSLGEKGGAGQLIIAEALCMHIDETVLNDEGNMIDQTKLHHVARLGGNWYCRVDENQSLPGSKAQQGTGHWLLMLCRKASARAIF
jgi:flavin reductase (DIM6/NTAB) family NADH-FMN oxidoreductase RutF